MSLGYRVYADFRFLWAFVSSESCLFINTIWRFSCSKHNYFVIIVLLLVICLQVWGLLIFLLYLTFSSVKFRASKVFPIFLKEFT
jgi:hypothetical protein